MKRRRVVLVPAPAQGHITPMMQLARALHLKGFSITVVQTKFNYLNPSTDLSDFQFVTIPENLHESDLKNLGPGRFLIKLAKECCVSFKELLGQLLVNEEIVCVIYDEFMYFVEAVVKEFKLRNVILSTTSATAFVCRFVMCKLYAKDGLAHLKGNIILLLCVYIVFKRRFMCSRLTTWFCRQRWARRGASTRVTSYTVQRPANFSICISRMFN